MKAGQLINSLFEISGVSKTDFAIFMNMSPSGLSKILTGSRLPPQKENGGGFQRVTTRGLMGALLLGLVSGLVVSQCATPVLAVILTGPVSLKR